ncbi:MAG TPA: hypothetical protein PLV92_17705, partial [Pirellulaceae bacterium]|nr:hypothetical protein [Pirellulaceae bacterium]
MTLVCRQFDHARLDLGRGGLSFDRPFQKRHSRAARLRRVIAQQYFDLERLVLPDTGTSINACDAHVARAARIADADDQQRHAAPRCLARRVGRIVTSSMLPI